MTNKNIIFEEHHPDDHDPTLRVFVDNIPSYDLYVYPDKNIFLTNLHNQEHVTAFYSTEQRQALGAIAFPYFESCAYIVEHEGLNINDYMMHDDDICTLRWMFNDIEYQYHWLFHDSDHNGLFLVKNRTFHSGTLDNIPERFTPSQKKACQYMIEHANNLFNMRHYAIWHTLGPLFQSLLSIQWEEDVIEYSMTWAQWKSLSHSVLVLKNVILNDIDDLDILIDSIKNSPLDNNEIPLLS